MMGEVRGRTRFYGRSGMTSGAFLTSVGIRARDLVILGIGRLYSYPRGSKAR